MARTIGFRCPDDLVAEIEHRQAVTGQNQTAVAVSMLRGLPSVNVEDRKTFPPVAATYIVWALSKLLYIGHTDHLYDCFRDHPRLVEFLNCNAKIAWFDSSGTQSLQIDSGLIELLFGSHV